MCIRDSEIYKKLYAAMMYYNIQIPKASTFKSKRIAMAIYAGEEFANDLKTALDAIDLFRTTGSVMPNPPSRFTPMNTSPTGASGSSSWNRDPTRAVSDKYKYDNACYCGDVD